MKRLLIAALITASLSQPARAGIPVTVVADIQAAIEFIQQGLWWVDQYRQMQEQYDELVKTHDALTGVRNLGDVLDNPQLRQYLPDDMLALHRAMRRSGYEGLVRSGVDIWNDNYISDRCGTRFFQGDEKLDCETNAAMPSQGVADADELYAKTVEQGMQIRDLQLEINGTLDPKAIAELQARIQIEQTNIANTSNQIQAIQMASGHQKDVMEQRQREFLSRTLAFENGAVLPATGLTFGD